MDYEKWNEHYLQQDEAEKKETIRVNQEKATAERTALVQRYNLCIDQLQELIPKLFKFYGDNPPREHYWAEIEGKKIAYWQLVQPCPPGGYDYYVDLFDLRLLVDGRIVTYRYDFIVDYERTPKHKPARFDGFISLRHDGALAFVNILESACEYIKDILEAPERERQAKIAAEEKAKKDVEKRRERLKNFPRVVVGKPENTTIFDQQRKVEVKKVSEQQQKPAVTGKPQQNAKLIKEAVLERQKNAAEQISSSPVTRFGKSFKNTIQNIYEISVEVLYILFGAIIDVVLVFIALFFLGRDQPLIAIAFCAIALYIFIRGTTKKFKHKKVDTLINQYWTKKQ